MSEALESKDSGDYVTAKAKLAELVKLVPNDPQVLRLIRDVELKEKAAAARPTLPPPPAADPGLPAPMPLPAAPAPVTPPVPAAVPASTDLFPVDQPVPEPQRRWRATDEDAGQLAADETARLRDQMDRVSRRLSHARDLVAEDRHQEALKELRQLGSALPSNPMTEPLLREIRALQVDVEHRVRVASISLKDTPPVLSIQYGTRAAGESVSKAVFTPSVDVELELLVLPDDVVNDLWSAWRDVARDSGEAHRTLLLDRQGRPEYQRPLSALLSPTQLSIYRALAAGKQDARTEFAPLSGGAIGFSAQFNPSLLVRTLASLPACRLLASPRLTVETGSPTILTLKTPSTDSNTDSEARQEALLPSWKISLTPKVGADARVNGLQFVVEASSYQGVVLRGSRNTNTDVRDTATAAAEEISGETRSSGFVGLVSGETLVLAGLPQTAWMGRPNERSPLDRLPWIGSLHRAAKAWGGAREILLIVRFLPAKMPPRATPPALKG